ncbi:hypothetical protein [Myxosarcina sp. GI1(2024)]
MDEKKAALTKAIAILLSVTPETTLGKFLALCLEAKVDEDIAGETPLAVAQNFIDKPTSLPYWTQEIICADGELKPEEWKALGEMQITDTDAFLASLWSELETIDIG